jgi:hypothetical protein
MVYICVWAIKAPNGFPGHAQAATVFWSSGGFPTPWMSFLAAIQGVATPQGTLNGSIFSFPPPKFLCFLTAHVCGLRQKSSMHRGRPYPYHPLYWSTEAWFWRGFVPWKLKVTQLGTSFFPWDQWYATSPVISFEGEAPGDAKRMDYVADVGDGTHYRRLIISLDKVDIGPTSYARWRMTMTDGGPGWCTAYALQPFPQRVVFVDSWDYTLPTPPYTCPTVPLIQCEPATYAEGGSPYS